MLYLIITLAMGLLVPLQTAANSRLRQTVGQAYLSTLISFSVSSLFLLLVAIVTGIPILPTTEMLQAAPWWSWFGGIIALLTITCAIYLFKELGQLQATIIPLFSQLLFSLAIDHFGWFGSRVIPMDGKRLVGSLLLLVGIVLVVDLPRLRGQQTAGSAKGARMLFWQLCAIVSGCLMASIGAIYALLGSVIGSPIQATTVSFLIATVAILLFCLCSGNLRQVRKAISCSHPWWMWLGGICGAICVYGNTWLIPKIGVGLFAMLLLIGQLLLSLLMEQFGWLGAPRKNISAIQIIGILLMLGGVALIRF